MNSNPIELPKIDLTTFSLSVSSAVFIHLGISESNSKVDLPLARQNIELLEMIFEKTSGNRTPDEDRLIGQLLFETRMRFVETQKKEAHK